MVKYIDQVDITNKRVLLRVDYNVSLNPDHSIANDARISQSLPTIKYLLAKQNKIILVSHFERPEGRDPKYSLNIVLPDLKGYLPDKKILLIDDFLTDQGFSEKLSDNDILLLENIRFYDGEQKNDPEFAKKLAGLADTYVNDAFSVSHREAASVVGVTAFLPSYGGLLLKKEVETIGKAIANPQKPFVAILGGAKISTKLKLINKLIEVADSVLLAGGLAHNFLKAEGVEIGKSMVEKEEIEQTKLLIKYASDKQTQIITPSDAVVATSDAGPSSVKLIKNLDLQDIIFDIGPETQAAFGAVIGRARTIIWNGPVGKFENPLFRRGTDFIYYVITQNSQAVSIIGGGETLAAIDKKEYLDKITHISTGGGAMLEFIENGTLAGIQALEKAQN